MSLSTQNQRMDAILSRAHSLVHQIDTELNPQIVEETESTATINDELISQQSVEDIMASIDLDEALNVDLSVVSGFAQ